MDSKETYEIEKLKLEIAQLKAPFWKKIQRHDFRHNGHRHRADWL